MSHTNSTLTPHHRSKVARLVVDDGWPISEVATHVQVSWPTVKRWAGRYRAGRLAADPTQGTTTWNALGQSVSRTKGTKTGAYPYGGL